MSPEGRVPSPKAIVVSETDQCEPLTLGTAITRALKREKISQRELARIASIDHSTISRIINGERESGLSNAGNLLAIVGATEAEILAVIATHGRAANAPRTFFISNGLQAITGSFGDQMKGYMKQLNLTSRGLAERSGVDHTTIYRIALGNRMPSVTTGSLIIEGLSRLRDNQKIDMFLAPYRSTIQQTK